MESVEYPPAKTSAFRGKTFRVKVDHRLSRAHLMDERSCKIMHDQSLSYLLRNAVAIVECCLSHILFVVF